MQNGTESVVAALTDLRHACRFAKAAGRSRSILPGMVKAVTVTLLNSLHSWSCVNAALMTLHTVLGCCGNMSLAMRYEGGLKACDAVLKRYSRRSAAVQMTCRMLRSGLLASCLTGAALLQVHSRTACLLRLSKCTCHMQTCGASGRAASANTMPAQLCKSSTLVRNCPAA